MKAPALIVPFILAATSRAIGAETAFRCIENGKTVFSEISIGPSCQPLDLKVYRPDPQEVERRQRELEQWNRQREMEVRRILDREAAAETQRRKAELDALGMDRARAGKTGHRSRGSRRRSGGGFSLPKLNPQP
jgi:hypothetical protein